MAISIHPPLAGRDTSLKLFKRDIVISIHPPLAGRDAHCACPRSAANISIHPPLAGRDLKQQPSQSNQKNFNPPAPCGAGPPFLYHSFTKIYISIHPPLAGRDSSKDDADTVMRISIHPPLAGRDTAFLRDTLSRAISIHPPLAGRDIQFLDDFRRAKFQSTRPLRGGTCNPLPHVVSFPHFNPPAPCGAGQRSCTKKLCKTSHIAQKVHLPWPY